jgi:hypothetical protein
MDILTLFLAMALANAVPLQHQHATDRAHHGMGFDQQKTVHHFLLQTGGGTIDVIAKDPADRTSIDQIRMHLQHISVAFKGGDFSLPTFIHDTDPPGVETLKARREQLIFTYQERPAGGAVVITTTDEQARGALHDFLRFQIKEHKTGDPLTVDGK